MVGEAASCLSDEMRGRLSGIPWREVRGFRNVAVHAYFSLDWDVVHEVATVNLPAMAPQVLAVLRAEDPEIAATFGTKDDDAPGSERIPLRKGLRACRPPESAGRRNLRSASAVRLCGQPLKKPQ